MILKKLTKKHLYITIIWAAWLLNGFVASALFGNGFGFTVVVVFGGLIAALATFGLTQKEDGDSKEAK